jgi:hypothetical protein
MLYPLWYFIVLYYSKFVTLMPRTFFNGAEGTRRGTRMRVPLLLLEYSLVRSVNKLVPIENVSG